MFKDKSILITGGAGSLGYALVEKLLNMQDAPRRIIILSRDDHKHVNMEKHFNYNKRLRFFIGDVRDIERLRLAFKDVDYVIHAAALKHVDRGEYNPLEYKKTIVDGAENVIRACIDERVKRCVALSTDKSCAPYNTYGSAKLLSDKLFVAGNNYDVTKFAVIRYGNVIGSNGSATKNITSSDESEKITIYNTEMTRFWITLDYAAYLVLLLLTGMGGEELLIPKLPSMKVLDLFKVIKPNAEIIVGDIRPGEKIHEQMFTLDDARYTYEYKNYYIIYPCNSDRKKVFLEESGKTIDTSFEYKSNTNKWFLTPTEAKLMLKNEMVLKKDLTYDNGYSII